jgi:hypothetical protein
VGRVAIIPSLRVFRQLMRDHRTRKTVFGLGRRSSEMAGPTQPSGHPNAIPDRGPTRPQGKLRMLSWKCKIPQQTQIEHE